MTHCRVCNEVFAPFLSFGQQPLANAFLEKQHFSKEYFFELAVGFCKSCTMVQLVNQPDPNVMFHGNYSFFSQTSRAMEQHFAEFAQEICERFLKVPSKSLVIELGSNDGIFLKHFKSKGIPHLGIEPSKNVAEVAKGHGIETWVEFFDEGLAEMILQKVGQADAITAANCMCHIPAIHAVANGMKKLLKPGGVIAFEDPYLGDILEKTSYDQIYDEHVFLFSLSSIRNVFSRHGLDLFDVKKLETHGGSMRYYLCHENDRKATDAVQFWLQKEAALGVDRPETFRKFKDSCESSRRELVDLLNRLKREKKRVIGYAATSKSTTVINYCGLGPDLIEFISDTTPIKHGKFSPGKHIPVKPYEKFKTPFPEYALLFGWNHAKEIMEKEQEFVSKGGKWIVYVPRVEIVE